MTGFDLMKLLHRLEASSRRDFMPHHGHRKQGDTPHQHSGPPPSHPLNVHHGKGRMISVLWRHAGITQKELSERLAIRPQSLSEALSKLEADGIIYRERSPEDKRELRLYLTESGKKTAEEVHAERVARAEDFFSPLTDQEKEALGALLTKLCLADEAKQNEKTQQ